MKQLAYVSTAVRLMTDNELIDILKVARSRNAENDVTGVLLYSDGTFIQVLEGGADRVDQVFESISNDKRHKNLIKLVDSNLDKKHFPDWNMGFAAVDKDKAREITGFLSSTGEILDDESGNMLASILKTFIATNNLLIEN
ncbi:MAG: BLUF domain-containing protein [Bacteroidota bacterium]